MDVIEIVTNCINNLTHKRVDMALSNCMIKSIEKETTEHWSMCLVWNLIEANENHYRRIEWADVFLSESIEIKFQVNCLFVPKRGV